MYQASFTKMNGSRGGGENFSRASTNTSLANSSRLLADDSESSRSMTNSILRPSLPSRWSKNSDGASGLLSGRPRANGGKNGLHRSPYAIYESRYAEIGGKSAMAQMIDDSARVADKRYFKLDDVESESSGTTDWTSTTNDVVGGALQLRDANIELFEQAEKSIVRDINASTGVIEELKQQRKAMKKTENKTKWGKPRTRTRGIERREGVGNAKPPSYDVTFGFQSHAFQSGTQLTGRRDQGGRTQAFVFDGGEDLTTDTADHDTMPGVNGGNGVDGVDGVGGEKTITARGTVPPPPIASCSTKSPLSPTSPGMSPTSSPGMLLGRGARAALKSMEKTVETINVVRKQGKAAQGLGGLRRSPLPDTSGTGVGSYSNYAGRTFDCNGIDQDTSVKLYLAANSTEQEIAGSSEKGEHGEGSIHTAETTLSPWLVNVEARPNSDVISEHVTGTNSHHKYRTARRVKKI